MRDYKPLYGKHVLYKDVNCRILRVPINDFMNVFELMPSKAIDDIGNGPGRMKQIYPLEFEVECIIDIQQPIKRES